MRDDGDGTGPVLAGRVCRVVADVLGVDADRVTLATDHMTIGNWDSANALQLALALEAEFDVMFEPEELADMVSVELIVEILRQKIVAPPP